MSPKSKLAVKETGRWIRVGVFSASALLPMVNTALNRIRARQEAEAAVAHETTADYYKENLAHFTHSAQSEVQERLQAVGSTLGDVLTELRTRSNNQDLIKRTHELREDLRDRRSKLSRAIVERSGEVSHELVKRSGEVSHEVAKRGRQAQLTIAEQKRSFWIALGFSFGLTVTGIVTFVLIRRRLQQTTEVEEPSIQLSYTAAPTTKPEIEVPASESRGGIYALPSVNGSTAAQSNAAGAVPPIVDDSTSSVADQPVSATPADAAFVGVASTKYYYPVETPLDQLADVSEKPVDIIYFASETEARSQGFQAAEV